MIVARTREGLGQGLADLHGRGSVGFVPTMGNLHDGHLSLVDLALDEADVVVVSIFVNPLQFAPSEDLEAYPRTEERDLALLEERRVDLTFLPSVDSMYPDGEPVVTVDPGPLENALCGPYRPGHFRGVLTVVARFFGLLRPDLAVFGRKDYQQLVLVRRMVRDLELGVRVVEGPVVREADGLAMSSRNAYLSEEERSQAPAIYEALEEARRRVEAGERSAVELLRGVHARIGREARMRVQYAEIVNGESLRPVERAGEGTVAAVAAFCGSTRLIDNAELV